MHICFLCNEYPPHSAGVGVLVQTLGRALVVRGHRVTVLGLCASEHAGEESDHGVRVIRLARARVPRAGVLVNAARLRTALREIHRATPIDVIEGSEWSFSLLPTRTRAKKVIRMNGGHLFFATELGQKPRRVSSWWERRSFARADRLCAVSRYVAEKTRELHGLAGVDITVIPNPVDVSRFAPRADVREEDGSILFIGTVCEKKGVRQLVEAMPRIVARHPKARLRVVGPDWLDPTTGASYTAQLAASVPTELKPHILFDGPILNSELPPVLAAAQVAVYPSHMEAHPLAWLEGMAMAKAIVASRTGPGPEVIEDGISGLLCDPHDPASIADAVIRLLDDAILRRRLGEAARDRALRHFSARDVAERSEHFYRACVSGVACV